MLLLFFFEFSGNIILCRLNELYKVFKPHPDLFYNFFIGVYVTSGVAVAAVPFELLKNIVRKKNFN